MIRFLPIFLIFFIGCEIGSNEIESIRFIPNMNLPKDANGYYHLTLSERWQTTHTIGGNLYRNGSGVNVIKTAWGSNMYWEYGNEDCYIKEVDNINYSNCADYDFDENLIVPIINSSAYSREDGSVNSVIAPIKIMKGDTITIFTAWYDNWLYETSEGEPIYIVLD